MSLSVLGMAALVFAARVADVSLGTLRTSFIVRGRRGLAFAVGFCETLVWVVVVAQVISNLDHPIYVIAFALGFATGTVAGITVEGWFAIGEVAVRVFATNGDAMASALRGQGYAVTLFPGTGRDGAVYLLFIQVPRRQSNTVIAAVRAIDPSCFYTVDDVRLASSAPPAKEDASPEQLAPRTSKENP